MFISPRFNYMQFLKCFVCQKKQYMNNDIPGSSISINDVPGSSISINASSSIFFTIVIMNYERDIP